MTRAPALCNATRSPLALQRASCTYLTSDWADACVQLVYKKMPDHVTQSMATAVKTSLTVTVQLSIHSFRAECSASDDSGRFAIELFTCLLIAAEVVSGRVMEYWEVCTCSRRRQSQLRLLHSQFASTREKHAKSLFGGTAATGVIDRVFGCLYAVAKKGCTVWFVFAGDLKYLYTSAATVSRV